MPTPASVSGDSAIDFYHARIQSDFLALHLQLAEFETTYKTKSGKEIKVTRSPDGKFANTGSSRASSSIPNPKSKESAPKTSNTAKLVKDLLSGETGNRIKDALVAMSTDPDIKIGIRKASFAEILNNSGDAMSSASSFVDKKMKVAKSVASKQLLGAIIGEIVVDGFVLAAVASATATAAGASIPAVAEMVVGENFLGGRVGDTITTERFKRENANKFKEVETPVSRKGMEESFERMRKDRVTQEKLYREIGKEITIEDAGRGNEEEQGENEPPLISPEVDSEISESLLGEAGETLKAGLIVAVAQRPEIAKGIKDTKIEDVIKGTKDTFGNAVDFMHSQIDKAANAVSENQEELAIGAAVVGVGVVGALLGLAIAATATAVIGDSVAGVIAGRTLSGAAQFALKRLSVDRVKDLVKVLKLPVAIATGVSVVNTIGNVKEQVQAVKARKTEKTSRLEKAKGGA